MPAVDANALDRAIEDLPKRYPGPGGAVAVVKDGEPIVRHAPGASPIWRRRTLHPRDLAPICSISKQFTCATLLDIVPDPSALDAGVAGQLPRLEGAKPTTLDLANNQSGLRDYWALTVLAGRDAGGRISPRGFGAAHRPDTEPATSRPAPRYSYSNGNFRMLAVALEERTARISAIPHRARRAPGRHGDGGLHRRDRRPARRASATRAPRRPAGGPGINRIHWKGDAGICASIDDMIAWERFIDRTRDDADGIYRRLSAPADLSRRQPGRLWPRPGAQDALGPAMTGHGGAIRGWRLQRFWVPSERLSVAIAFNHESDSQDAAMHVLAAALGESDAPEPSDAAAAKPFVGRWLDDEIGLLLDISANADGTISPSMTAARNPFRRCGRCRPWPRYGAFAGGRRPAHRPTRRRIRRLARPSPRVRRTRSTGPIVPPSWRANSRSSMPAGAGSAPSRASGRGPLMPMASVGPDLWRLVCHRSLDAPAPGDWTVRVRRSADGRPETLSVGCWLARDVEFRATSSL